MTSLRKLPATIVAPVLLLAMLLVLAACGGAGASTPTPTPTPTPEPLPANPFMELGDDATMRDMMERVPADERNCIRESMGDTAYQQMLDRPVFAEESLEPWDAEVDLSCLSNETLTALFTATLDHQAGGLSDESLRCLQGVFSGIDLRQLVSGGMNGEPSPGQMGQLIGSMMSMVLCLSDEEAERLDLFGGEGESDFTLADLRCLAQRVDLAILVDFFTIAEEGRTPTPDDLRNLADLMEAAQECGVDFPMDDSMGMPGGSN